MKIKFNPWGFCRFERLYCFHLLTLSDEVNFIPQEDKIDPSSNTEEKSCGMQRNQNLCMPFRSSVPSSSGLNPLFLCIRLPLNNEKPKAVVVLQSPFKGCWESERSTQLLL